MLRAQSLATACALAVVAAGMMAPPASAMLATVQPDLVIAQIHDFIQIVEEDEASKVRIQFLVWNKGTAAAPASDVHLAFQDIVTSTAQGVEETAKDLAITWDATVAAPALLPGEWKFMDVYSDAYAGASPVPGDVGRWHLTATIDASESIAEMNEGNNVHEKDVFTGSIRAPE